MNDADLPKTFAIAGAWGYIGRKFLDAALALGIRTFVYDPGPAPDFAGAVRPTIVPDEATFYALPADVFHLALHPQHRTFALETLLGRRNRGEDPLVLLEKPMAAPENPETCAALVDAVRDSGLALLFDFTELYDPMTERICTFLAGFEEVRIAEFHMQRSKDRENPDNPRNHKVMVPIQYQETVHSIAFVLHVLGRLRHDLAPLWNEGISMRGTSEPYRPPNPEDYPCEVDGRCLGEIRLHGAEIHVNTNFKAGAPLAKRRRITGVGDGRPFVIEASYLEGHKFLAINGEDRQVPPETDSCRNVIRRLWSWYRTVDRKDLNGGVYPNAAFARVTYLLSSMLWDACATGKTVSVDNGDELARYAPRFPAIASRT